MARSHLACATAEAQAPEEPRRDQPVREEDGAERDQHAEDDEPAVTQELGEPGRRPTRPRAARSARVPSESAPVARRTAWKAAAGGSRATCTEAGSRKAAGCRRSRWRHRSRPG